MTRDQVLGALLLVVCSAIIVAYVVCLLLTPYVLPFLRGVWPGISQMPVREATGVVRFWLVAIPVAVAFVLVFGIGAWIGWTMATTPPPKPIEFEEEEEAEEEGKEETSE